MKAEMKAEMKDQVKKPRTSFPDKKISLRQKQEPRPSLTPKVIPQPDEHPNA